MLFPHSNFTQKAECDERIATMKSLRRLSISEIKFGSIDARNEILARDLSSRQLFLDSFCVPPSFRMEDLINGERFLICGPKGSGKTAFLRYLQHELEKQEHAHTRFIVFRDEVTAQDREKLISTSNVRLYEGTIDSNGNSEPLGTPDCLSAWQLFIHREIAAVLAKNTGLCALTPEVGGYIRLVQSFFAKFNTSAFKKLLQKLTKGRIKIQALGQALEAEAEFIDRHGNVDVSEFVRYCNSVVRSLHFAEGHKGRINIFFDELNISFVSGQSFRTNAILIRDLVAACGTLNAYFAEGQLPIYIYSHTKRGG